MDVVDPIKAVFESTAARLDGVIATIQQKVISCVMSGLRELPNVPL